MTEHQTQIQKLSADFDKIQNIDDFIFLLKSSYFILSKGKSKKIFKASVINYYAYHCNNRYSAFTIPKKNGKARKINSPIFQLKLIQRCLNLILESKFIPHDATHGFLTGKSIVSNATGHSGKSYVLNIDLENFFESINVGRVKAILELPPFNLNEKIALLISNLSCNKGVLPQGAPSSPILTNIICQRLDRKLSQFAKKKKTKYSRYADDITFSTNNDIFNDTFINDLKNIIEEEGFKLNNKKTRIQDWRQKQEVTGLVVNHKVNISREFIRGIRAILNNFERHGYEYTQKKFILHWNKHGKLPPKFSQSLKGKIEYLGMVRGKKDHIYLQYKRKYFELLSGDFINYSFIKNDNVRNQLEKDCKKMLDIKMNTVIPIEDKFKEYCTAAFFQLEELVNYFLTQIMSFEKLLEELDAYTFLNKKKSNGRKDIGQIESVYKIYLLEKYLYYDHLDGYYNSILEEIRLVRIPDSIGVVLL